MTTGPATPESTVAPVRTRDPVRDMPWWLTGILVLAALGVLSLAYAAIASPSTLLQAGQHADAATRVWARYAAAYSLALGVMLLALLAVRARRILAGTLVQAALAEVLLGAVGIIDHRWDQVVADVVLVVVFLAAASRLFGRPLWQVATWRDDSQRP